MATSIAREEWVRIGLFLIASAIFARPIISSIPLTYAIGYVVAVLIGAWASVLPAALVHTVVLKHGRQNEGGIPYLFLFVGLAIISVGRGWSLPAIGVSTFADRARESSPLLTLGAGFVAVASMSLANRSRLGRMASVAFVAMIIFTGGNLSRGTLVFAVAFILGIANIITVKAWMLIGATLALIAGGGVVATRLGASPTDIAELIHYAFVELQPQDGLLVNHGIVPLRQWIMYLFFFLPSGIRGTFDASNLIVSEQLFGVDRSSSWFYVMTLGDFGLSWASFGWWGLLSTTWLVMWCFGMLRSLTRHFTSFRLFFLAYLVLIGARAGLESLVFVLWWGFTFPLVLLSMLELKVTPSSAPRSHRKREATNPARMSSGGDSAIEETRGR